MFTAEDTLMPGRFLSPSAARTAAVLLVLAFAPAAHAQTPTDYFWNPNNNSSPGGGGTWDTNLQIWGTTSTGPNSYTWQNTGFERANFAGAAGTVTINTGGTGVSAYGLNFTVGGYTIAGDPLTLTGAGGVISATTGTTTIGSVIGGTVGLTATGGGTLVLTAANTYTGGTTVMGETLAGVAQASGSPFGSGPVTMTMGILQLNGLSTPTTTTVGTVTVTAASGTWTGASVLAVNASAGGATTLAAGNLVRGGAGSMLGIIPATGSLGTNEVVTFTNGTALQSTNPILPPWVVATATASNPAVDFVAYGATGGVAVAQYFAGDLTSSTNANVVNQSNTVTLAGPAAAYALKTNVAINLNGNTLTLGTGTGTAGLILNNGASVGGGTVTFGAAEGMVYVQGAATLGAAGDTISSGGLTVTASGPSVLTVNGTIADGGVAARVIFTGSSSGTGLVLNAANTYTGGTTLSVNTGTTGNVVLGNNAAFGTGKVTNILLPGAGSPQFQASVANLTLANAFDLSGGINFTGANGMTFAGPITIINAAAGGTRTLQTTSGSGTVTFGAAGSPSTITLGNPAANGGDNVGKVLGLTASAGTTIVLNDVLQDPAPGGGTASGGVVPGGGGTVVFNGMSTYTGVTNLSSGTATTIQIGASSNSPFTAGPFGTGILQPNNGTNSPLQPVGADRTVANPVNMITGFTVNNSAATGETTRSLILSGPIVLNSTQGRTINNSMTPGATLTLGSAAAPSTITLNPATNNGASVVLTISTGPSSSSGIFTVINDVIQDPTPRPATPDTITVSGPDTITFNAMNTFAGGMAFTGAGTIVPIVLSSNALPGAGFTAGPFGTGQININNGTNQHFRPTGGNRVISNSILLTTGIAMDNNPGESFNLTLAGPITMTNNRFISNGFVAGTTGGTLILGDPSAPKTITLPATSTFQLSLAALAGPIVVNDVMVNAAGQTDLVVINPNGGDNNSVTLNGASTYTGNTTIGGGANGGGPVLLGVSTVGNPGAITSGPFGLGTVVMNNTAATSGTPPNLIPIGADRTIANAITMTSGFFASTATAAQDPTGPHNLTLTGPITLGSSRILTNNMAAGATLTIGAAGGSSAVNLGANTLTIQNQPALGAGATVINSQITGTGGLTVQGGGTVTLTNANSGGNNYSGATLVTGGTLLVTNTTGSATGTGLVTVSGNGTIPGGGTLGGTGTIAGGITISDPTVTTNQGGKIAPGVGTTIGTLTSTGTTTFNPQGTYQFKYNAAVANPVAGVHNDTINPPGSPAGTLDLSSLSPTSPFLVTLTPTGPPLPSATTSYVAGSFTSITLPSTGGFVNPGDVTPLFAFSGPGTWTAAVNGGVLTFTAQVSPVPEPGCVLLACAAAAGGWGWCRRRRSA
jgi:autotransporter-associated beta strand protein